MVCNFTSKEWPGSAVWQGNVGETHYLQGKQREWKGANQVWDSMHMKIDPSVTSGHIPYKIGNTKRLGYVNYQSLGLDLATHHKEDFGS